MDVVTVFLVALGLAMDCFSVSITSGLAMKVPKIGSALRIGASFGSFQAFMPIIGWLGGVRLAGLISGVDHWVAFGLLALIGCKMIYDSALAKTDRKGIAQLDGYVLLMLSVATSIDALAVGMSLAFLKISIVAPVVVIGALTFVLSFLGVYVGFKFGHFFENKIEIAGGFILIGIGVKILIEHLHVV